MYIAGGPIEEDQDFYGRSELVTALLEGEARRVFLVGLRRTGKTSVLKALERRAADRGLAPLFLQLQGLGSGALREVAADAVDALLVALGGEGLSDEEFDGASLRQLLRRTEQAVRGVQRPLLVLVDEAEVLVRVAEADAEPVSRLRTWLLGPGVHRVVLSGGRHAIRLAESGLLGEGEPFLAGFRRRLLEPVLDERAASELVRLARRSGVGAVELAPREHGRLVARTGGHPFVLQAACLELRRHGGTVDEALEALLESHAAEWAFLEDLQRTSPSERRVLDAVVAGHRVPPGLGAFARTLEDAGLLGADHSPRMPLLGEFLGQRGWAEVASKLTDAQAVPGARSPSLVGGSSSYRLERCLGGGTFGVVYLARLLGEAGFERRVALKVLREDWVLRPSIVARMRDEARILGLLQHPAIVRVELLTAIEGRVALVMEYVEGLDLLEIIERSAEVGPAPPRVVAGVAARAAEALDLAWSTSPGEGRPPLRVLHRDLKPANLRLTPFGELKILDFGIAWSDFEGREARTLAGGLGTPSYLAPERQRGQHDLPASDVYALGLVLVELARGQVLGPMPTEIGPHETQVGSLVADLGEISGLVTDMLAYEAEDRPMMAEVAESCWRVEAGALRPWAGRVLAALMPAVPGAAVQAALPTVGLLGETLEEGAEDSDWGG